MAKVSPIITNFTAGELSPRMLGRVDFAKYPNGCEILENFVVMTQGGAIRRPGTYFANEAKWFDVDARLIPFIFSTVQAYILEVGDLYIRFYMNGGRIESPPGTPVEIVTPYDDTMIRAVNYAQSADVMYLAHGSVAPQKLTRTSHTAWTISAMNFIDGPYMDENTTTTTLTPAATSGTGINVTASAITGINNNTGFQTTDVGRWIRIKHASTWGWAKITARTSTTVVVVDIVSNFGAITASAVWRLGSWSNTTGWPKTVSFHEDRLVWGGTVTEPQTKWSSKVSGYENYGPTKADSSISDEEATTYTLLSDQVNPIRWITSGESLAIGTGGGEWIAQGATRQEPITPTSISVRRHTTRGSAELKPIRVDTAILYLQKAGRKIRELSYNQDRDAYLSLDISVLAEHITISSLVDWDYQQEPHNVVWGCRADGLFLGFTYNKEQDVIAFHRHPVGGTNAKVLSVAVIPTEQEYDEVWLLTERTIDSTTVKYIEYMAPDHDPVDPDDKDQAFYVDCGLTYVGPPASTFGGLEHLVGETVSVMADGAVRPNVIVNGAGQITLAAPASVVHAGLPYSSKIKPVRFEAGGDKGTAQMKPKRMNKVGFRFSNTLGGKFGTDETHLEDINFRTGSDPMDASPPLFTGDKVLTLGGTYDLDAQVMYVNDQPYPAQLLAIVPEAVVYG